MSLMGKGGEEIRRETPLRRVMPRQVFCPPSKTISAPKLDWIAAFYKELSAREPTLYLVQDDRDSLFGAKPGLETLFAVRLPSLGVKALVSAAMVISCRWDSVQISIANEVPAIFLALNQKAYREAKRAKVPCWLVGGKATPSQIVAAVRAIRANYPWDSLSHFPRALSEVAPRETEASVTLRFCVIASVDYVPFLLGLIENLYHVHGESLAVDLLALDEATARFATAHLSDLNLSVYSLRDLWEEEALSRIKSRPLAQQAFSSKAKLLKVALSRTKGPVFYFDLDLFFYRSPVTLAKSLRRATVLLFPQWNQNLTYARLHGMFNAGMIGVAPGAERFLDWWSELCLFKCEQEVGFFDDQGFLDMAPVYFDKVRIYRRGDEDVAFWNMATLGLSQLGEEGRPRLKNGLPIGSLHAAQPDELGAFEKKYAWDQMVTFFSPFRVEGAMGTLFQNIVLQQKNHFPELLQLYKAFHLLKHRLDLNVGPLTPEKTSFFIEGSGKRLLKIGHPLYRALRHTRNAWLSKWRSPTAIAETGGPFWIELQQRELYHKR